MKKALRMAGCVALLILTGPVWAQVPAGWQVVKSPKPYAFSGEPPGKGGQCQMAVPGNWVPSDLNKFGGQTHFNTPPNQDARASAGVYEFTLNRSFADAKKGVTRYNEPEKVFEDSPTRYFYQSKASSSAFTVWDVVVAGHPACALEISFNSPSLEETARKIALSLRPPK